MGGGGGSVAAAVAAATAAAQQQAAAAVASQQQHQQQHPLISLMGTVVPQPPPLTGNVDPTKIEEIRRTVYVGNLNSSVSNYTVGRVLIANGEEIAKAQLLDSQTTLYYTR